MTRMAARLSIVLSCLWVASFGACGSGGGGATPPPDAGSSGPLPIDPTAFGQRFKVADNEIGGWTQGSAFDAFWAGTDLITGAGIDGAAGAYTANGFRQGMFQNLDGPQQQTCSIRAMDFGTAAAATKMFTDSQTNSVSNSTAIPTYDLSIAIGDAAISGLTVFAHFGALYFEVRLSGLGDQRTTCTECPVAQQFLDDLKTKTN
jgi:hypothetical protein